MGVCKVVLYSKNGTFRLQIINALNRNPLHTNAFGLIDKNLHTFVDMKASNSIKKKASLSGLLLAFVLSAVVVPAFSADRDSDSNNQLHLTSNQDSHSTPNIPLPPPEEEKEEESRTDKSHSYALILFSVVFELQLGVQTGPTTWAFNHTNASALTEFPLYLAKQSLLI
jgi:hypothetical protein